MGKKGAERSAKKEPDATWIVGEVAGMPQSHQKPYLVRLMNKRIAFLPRNVAKRSVGYASLKMGTLVKCDLNDRGEERVPLVRHCALA